MLEIQLQYKGSPFVCPTLTREVLLSAGETALRLLLLLASDPSARRFEPETLAEQLEVGKGSVEKALAFLEKNGILTLGEQERTAKEETGKTKPEPIPKRTRVNELPLYNDAEFTEVLSIHPDYTELITEAQNSLGKIFNLAETKLLVGMIETFGFDTEYWILLLNHCRKIGKVNLRYAEALAAKLYDKHIDTAVALDEYLHMLEDSKTLESTVRTLFGLGSRKLSPTQEEYIEKWSGTYRFTPEMIQKAYEITVDTAKDPGMKYMNRVLENWFSAGIQTLEDVEKAQKKHDEARPADGSRTFNVDDFFKAALDRSYGKQ